MSSNLVRLKSDDLRKKVSKVLGSCANPEKFVQGGGGGGPRDNCVCLGGGYFFEANFW